MNLENKILNILKESEKELRRISRRFKLPIPKKIVKIKSKNKSYKDISRENYSSVINNLESSIKDYHSNFATVNHELNADARELKKIGNYIKKQNKIFGDLYDIDSYNGDINGVKGDLSEISGALSDLHSAKKKISELNKDLSIIERINASEIYISDKEVENALNDMMEGRINRSRALKTILKKPEKPKNIVAKLTEIVKRKDSCEPYKPKLYNENDINFLKIRGIKGRKAKNIIDSYNFVDKKDFMLSLEANFEEKGYSSSEAHYIYKKFNVLDLDNGESQEYLDAVEDVLEAYNGVRGVLPRYRKKRFKSAKKIRSLIREDNPKVYVEGLSEIENRKDRDNLEKQLLSNPFNTGRRITKKSKVAHASLYDTCVKERGHEGHFRRESFGNRRTLFEVSRNKDDTLTVEVFRYFNNHSEYDSYYI